MASFCSNTAMVLENDFSILPNASHSTEYAFINMSNFMMEVNDNVGLEIVAWKSHLLKYLNLSISHAIAYSKPV